MHPRDYLSDALSLDLFPTALRVLSAFLGANHGKNKPTLVERGILESDLRKLGISTVEIEWLLNAVYSGSSETNQYHRRGSPVILLKKVDGERCFFVTAAGTSFYEDLLYAFRGRACPTGLPNGEIPQWNGRELRFRGLLVKRFRKPGPNQECILDEFESRCWTKVIANPLPYAEDISPIDRLHEAVKRLNKSLQIPILRFGGNGKGTGVCWRPVESPPQ